MRVLLLLTLCLLAAANTHAQIIDPERIGNRVSNKIERKVDKKVDETVDKVLEAPENQKDKKSKHEPLQPTPQIDLYGKLPPEDATGYGFAADGKTIRSSAAQKRMKVLPGGLPPNAEVPDGAVPITLVFTGREALLPDSTKIQEELWITFLFNGKTGNQTVVKATFGHCDYRGQATELVRAGLFLTDIQPSDPKTGGFRCSGVFELELKMDKKSTCKRKDYANGIHVSEGYFIDIPIN